MTFNHRNADTIANVHEMDLPESAYQGADVSWQRRWQKCINVQGMYFEEF
jgi:hypothetical protein